MTPRRRERTPGDAPPSGWRYRAYQAACVLGAILLPFALFALHDPARHVEGIGNVMFAFGVLSIGFAAYGVLAAERARTAANDRWRAMRRRDRMRAAGRHEDADESEVSPRRGRRRRGRLLDPRRYTLIEWCFLVYVVVGFPLLTRNMTLAAALVAFPTGGLIFFAVMNLEEGLRSGRYGRLGAKKRRAALLARAGRPTRWWSATPPPVLRVARAIFLAWTILGFLVCIAAGLGLLPWEAQDPRIVPGVYVAGFLVLLCLLGRSERIQRRVESEWLEGRRAAR